MENMEYFNPQEIHRRVSQRHRRQFVLQLHLVWTFLLSAIGMGLYSYVMPDRANLASVILLGLVLLWAMLVSHFFWKRSRDRAEIEIDVEMRRYLIDRDHDAAYRLRDDGELFYGEEVEYELKPKRKG
jgi:membrane protein YdbS with pleckstrin-like domain